MIDDPANFHRKTEKDKATIFSEQKDDAVGGFFRPDDSEMDVSMPGDIHLGVVVSISARQVLVNIGAKAEVVI